MAPWNLHGWCRVRPHYDAVLSGDIYLGRAANGRGRVDRFAIGSAVASVMPAGVVADFVNDAIFGGLGAFLVFAPLVFILTMIVGALEDSGYLARAALICHRPLSFFGLSGKSFVPLLSGVACAIPRSTQRELCLLDRSGYSLTLRSRLCLVLQGYPFTRC